MHACIHTDGPRYHEGLHIHMHARLIHACMHTHRWSLHLHARLIHACMHTHRWSALSRRPTRACVHSAGYVTGARRSSSSPHRGSHDALYTYICTCVLDMHMCTYSSSSPHRGSHHPQNPPKHNAQNPPKHNAQTSYAHAFSALVEACVHNA